MVAPRIAILLPCLDEELAVGEVVRSFAAALPAATIYVYDNASSDRTAAVAAAAGAVVRSETLHGKGHVVRRMFADVEADIYVMADGDATYDAGSAPSMIDLLARERLDMVVGTRVAGDEGAAYRPGHEAGNRWLSRIVAGLFGERFTDIFSGYRVFSRRFVKSFPALATGFEIETELTVHALELGLPAAELPTPYHARPQGSASKLSTAADGLRIVIMILRLYKDIHPFRFFGAIGAALAIVAVALATPLVAVYLDTGLVPRLPTAVLVTGIMLLAGFSFGCGLVLDTVARGRREAKRMVYLAHAPVD
ncbi:MAG: glycosyltransferase family 2 protein [Pseudomonadota bacterium]